MDYRTVRKVAHGVARWVPEVLWRSCGKGDDNDQAQPIILKLVGRLQMLRRVLQDVEYRVDTLQPRQDARRGRRDDAVEDEQSDEDCAVQGRIMSGNRRDDANFRSVQELRCSRDERHARTNADGSHELHGASPDDGRDAGDVAHGIAVCSHQMSQDGRDTERRKNIQPTSHEVRFRQRGELYLYVQK